MALVDRELERAQARVPDPVSVLGTSQATHGLITVEAERTGRTIAEHAKVSLVIPTKNEARNVSWVLDQVPTCVDEIVLVDGQSTDATLVMALSSRPDIRIVTERRPGKGNALRAGFEAANGDIIVMIDADGSMSPQEIPHYLYFLDNGYDFVKGSRFMAGGGSLDITRLRRLGNKALLGVVNVLHGAQLTDLCYGFCAFRRCFLEYLDLSSSGFEIETEMILGALRSGLRIAEVPSLELPRRSGQSSLRTFRDGERVLRTVLEDRYRPRIPRRRDGELPADISLSAGIQSVGLSGTRP